MSNAKYWKLISVGVNDERAKALVVDGYSLSKLRKFSTEELKKLKLLDVEIQNIKDTNRIPPNEATVYEVIHKSGSTCCICQIPHQPFIIHHIDEYSKTQDNSEGNLVLVCLNDHDRVHARSNISKNLSPDMVRDLKKKWEEKIEKRSIDQYLHPTDNGKTCHWDYINIRYLEQLPFDPTSLNSFAYLLAEGAIDRNGRILLDNILKIAGDNLEYLYNYGRIPVRPLFNFHMDLIKRIINANKVRYIQLDPSFTVDSIKECLQQIVLLEGRFYFKRGEKSKFSCPILVHGVFNRVRIEFEIDDFLFTSSSARGHLSGHNNTVSFLIVRDVQEVQNEKYDFVLKVSPIAVGSTYYSLGLLQQFSTKE